MKTKQSISLLSGLLCVMIPLGAARAKADSPPAGAHAQSIVSSGGFEDWQAAPSGLKNSMDCRQVPTGWDVQPRQDRASCSLGSDAAVKHGGRFSVRLGNTNTKSGLSISQRMDAEPEYRYVIRLWLKGDRVDAYHPKGIIVHVAASSQSDKHDTGFSSGVLRQSDNTPSPHSGTFDWHEFVCTFDTPAGTRSMMLLVELRGAGVVWLDDVRVTRLEKCIEVESY